LNLPSALTAVRMEKFEVWSASRVFFSTQLELYSFIFKSIFQVFQMTLSQDEKALFLNLSQLGYVYFQ
jgi:hypothetical protein